ncbi:MAG: tRNA (N6-isopentenyl adenosine(37)-C2)-methylthiotransferase MiaB [Selenomonas sp.]|uniref:tRNA (N6-isopentenyl adenosine(37)-C2)-methylthiotransferase MiaB n=1 Tax=Selenomonas sp. TaxID=2053611 RepID=UPI0025EFC3C7|nr:tRNA (N6-isopentenyl adenosine(37)-C2)-methylthiotransferase MiaB [Selenomonas sp.]MCI6231426.1 tRNA (N6-isopentenyl adenosine(37)-C2)-methylthiotransferase MiaB [Selenomonas sp.]
MESKQKKAFLLVYGCQMNVSDAERMAGELASIGYARTDDMTSADLILINTCCVRESAEDRVYGKIGEIKHLKEQNPRLIFGITGCMAQKEGDALIARAPHIDFVLGTSKVHELKNIVQEIEAERGLGAGAQGGASIATATRDKHGRFVDVNLTETELPDGGPVAREGKLSAWIPIMYGCNNFCTYCIVPYVRGRERSRRPEDVVAEVREAVAQGYKEVTLLGQNVNSYGKDHKLADFADLLKMVDEVPGIERVRFMTSHPKDLSDKLIETIAGGKHICEHIHLPVQYGSDKILSAMHRIYTVDSYRALVKRIRAAIPDVALTTDLIVGFPGETDEDFAQMLDFLREIRYDSAYTFIYSKRSGTPAAKMEDQVPDALKHERLEKLMAVQNEISREINDQFLDTVQEVMVEGPSKNDAAMWSGRTRTNKLVIFPHGAEQAGDFVQVKITHPQTWVLKGQQMF